METESGGTFYLEMTDPEGTPTWWWHDGNNLSNVGGGAYVDREPVEDTNYIFAVRG